MMGKENLMRQARMNQNVSNEIDLRIFCLLEHNKHRKKVNRIIIKKKD